MHSTMSRHRLLILAIFCVSTPFVYTEVTSFWRNLSLMALSDIGHTSIFLFNLAAIGREAVGVCAAALVLAAPLAWVITRRALFLASCLGISAAITVVQEIWMTTMFFSQIKFSLLSHPTLHLLMFFLFCWSVAALIDNARFPAGERSR